MKVTCTQDNLAKGLSIVSRLSDKTTHLPILNNVLLKAKKEGITLTATNLEIAIETKVRGKVDEEGEYTAQAKLLAEFIHTLQKENVSIELKDDSLHIKGDNHQTTIKGMDASDFPVIPSVEGGFEASIPVGEMRELLTQTAFSMSTDDSRPEINSAYFQFSKDRCTVAATDGFRLSEKVVPAKSSKEDLNVIVPAKTVNEVLRILDAEEGGEVVIRIADNQIVFETGSTTITSRTVSGEYPDYAQIVPKELANSVEVSIAEMMQAVKTTSLFCKQGINDVRISLDKRFDNIAVQAENTTFGKNVSNVTTKSKGQTMDIVFNYKFLLDGLNRMPGESVLIKTNDATSPAVIESPQKNGFMYVIMPIRQ